MMQAPFPWFGGKSKVAHLVWPRFGQVQNYVDPFFGSGAVLLNRPAPFSGPETINDLDGFVANFWRAIQADPAAVAQHADWPVSEVDLHARHAWLVAQRADLTDRLMGDPAYCDAKIAGWWVWGICSWIGSGWCSGIGPWQVIDGKLVDTRQLPHLGDAGRGINRKRPHLGNDGRGINRPGHSILNWFTVLSDRLRNVRVCCGDWTRVLGDTPTVKQGTTAILLDPPYADTAGRTSDLYACDDESVAHAVRGWALDHGDDPRLRIALCGYQGEHEMPSTWSAVPWKANGGYSVQVDGQGKANRHRETVWFSPHCRKLDLFEALAA
jgi:hypothetical protein